MAPVIQKKKEGVWGGFHPETPIAAEYPRVFTPQGLACLRKFRSGLSRNPDTSFSLVPNAATRIHRRRARERARLATVDCGDRPAASLVQNLADCFPGDASIASGETCEGASLRMLQVVPRSVRLLAGMPPIRAPASPTQSAGRSLGADRGG
jgi:hypothetical protein